MKRVFILIMLFSASILSGLAQNTLVVDEVSPFHEGLAAIKNADKWGFINEQGNKIIDFRSDLVKGKKGYPYFSNGLSKISLMQNGIKYFGFIDKTGEVVIKPQYLNVEDFQYGNSIALKVSKEYLGKNNLLGKDVVSYEYDEVVIDGKGEEILFVGVPKHLIYSKEKLREPPKISSRLISENLILIPTSNNNWELRPILD